MEEMADTNHLELRGNTWHYRRRVPTALADVLGKRMIRHSLKTSDVKYARRRRNELNVDYDRLFAKLESRGTAIGENATREQQPPISVLLDRVRSYVADRDQQSVASLRADPPETEAQRRDMLIEAATGVSVLGDFDNPNADQATYTTARRLLQSSERSPEQLEHAVEFFEIIRRGLLEVEKRRIDRLEGDFSKRVHDEMFRSDAPRTLTFAELVDVFWSEKEEDYRANGRNQQRVHKVQAALDFIIEAIGGETSVSAINDDTVQSFRRTLSRFPANRRKIYPNLTIEKSIERAERDEVRLLKPITQRFYLNVFSQILQVGVRKQYVAINYAEGVTPIKKDDVSADAKRLPWTNAQLIGFFTGKFYQACAPNAPEPYTKKDRHWRFWLPLMMLFLGMRPSEVAQLHVDDLKQTAAGTWYLDLIEGEAGNGEKKTLKTESSRRRVPMHPVLVKIGFFAFVEHRKLSCTDANRRMFPELQSNKYGNAAAYATRRLREAFIPAEIKLEERQTLYSLRHNVRDALRRVEAPAETLLAVTGWSPAGKAVESNYGDPGNPDFHAKWVERIDYPGLDLSFLFTEILEGESFDR